MKTLEQLKAEQAKQTAELMRQHEAANACPLVPDQVTIVGAGDRAPWVSYKRETLAQALEVFKAFSVIPSEHFRASSSVIMPREVMTKRETRDYVENERAQSSGPYACWLDVRHYGHANSDSAELVFYAQTGAGPVRVSVKFGAGYIGQCHGLRAVIVSREHDRRGTVIAQKFGRNPEAAAMADHVIKWGAYEGAKEESAQFSYLFVSDQFETMPGADQSHALAQLSILADRAKI
jgi:hypothetical protein